MIKTDPNNALGGFLRGFKTPLVSVVASPKTSVVQRQRIIDTAVEDATIYPVVAGDDTVLVTEAQVYGMLLVACDVAGRRIN